MKKFYLIFMLLSISYLGIGQSLSHDVVGTSGAENANATAQLSWTLGEIVTATLSTSTETLTQGFQQTQLFLVSTRDLENNLKIIAYPNPFGEYIRIQKDTDEVLYLECIDVLGRVLHQEKLTNEVQTINLSTLASAIYFAKITNKNGQLIKLIKIQKQ